jgi:hypothetical protein
VPWSITSRLVIIGLLIAAIWGGGWYVLHMRDSLKSARESVKALEADRAATAKATLRSYEMGVRYEQDKDRIKGRVSTDVRYVDRLRIVPSEPVECATSGKPDEKAEPGLSRADVAALEATLRTIAGESFRIAGQANECAAQLNGLIEFIEKSTNPTIASKDRK